MSEWVVHHGDALEVLPTLDAGSIDAIVTDPPYGMSLDPQRGRTKAIANDGRAEARSLWFGIMPGLRRIIKPNTSHLFFSRWSEVWAKSVLEEWFVVKGCVVWRKNVFGLGYYLRPQWEMAWYCHHGEPPVPDRADSDVWDCNRVHEPSHSCEKPVELMQRAIDLCCPPDGTVLDPFCGSGTTGVACRLTGRRFIGIEKDARYVEIARRRIADAASLFARSEP